MNLFIKKVIYSVLILGVLFFNFEPTQSYAVENCNTCTQKENEMNFENVNGSEKENYIEEALNTKRVQDIIEYANEQGYLLRKRVFK